MSSEKNLRIGQKVEVAAKVKNVRGEIAYIGLTNFAVGKWIGVILDEPAGKNNGSISGQVYFKVDADINLNKIAFLCMISLVFSVQTCMECSCVQRN